ncbi:MAG TPA: hypothetical protein VGX94_05180 [Terriglobia bacterium]|nr:hypothetical protein [Terriglobia bacterium]
MILSLIPYPLLRERVASPSLVILSEAKNPGISAQGKLREPGEGHHPNSPNTTDYVVPTPGTVKSCNGAASSKAISLEQKTDLLNTS